MRIMQSMFGWADALDAKTVVMLVSLMYSQQVHLLIATMNKHNAIIAIL